MKSLHQSIVFIIIALTIAPFAFGGDTSGSFATPNVHPFTPTQFTILDADSNCGGGALGLWDSGSPAQDNYTTHFLNVTFNYTIADDTNADNQWVMICAGSDYSRVDDISNSTILTAGEGDGTASLIIHNACDVFNGFNLSDDLYLENANYSNDYGPLDRTDTLDSDSLLVTSPTENASINYNAVPNEPLMLWVVIQVFDNQSNNNVSDVRFYNITILNRAPYWSSPGDVPTNFNIIGQSLNVVPTPNETHNVTPSFDWDDLVNFEDGTGADKCPADTINITFVMGNESQFVAEEVHFTNSSQGTPGSQPESSFNWSDGLGLPDLRFNRSETNEGGWSNRTYYIRVNATDGLQGGNSPDLDREFDLTDNLPDLSALTFELNHSGSGYNTTHNRTPVVYWGAINERDGDTVDLYFTAGTGTSGSSVSDIISDDATEAIVEGFASNFTSNFFGTTINYSSEGANNQGNGQWGNETVYVLVRANDSASGLFRSSGNITPSFMLTNYLPNISSVEFSDVSINPFVLCNDINGTGTECQLDPIASGNVSLAVRINSTDADGDCSDENYFLNGVSSSQLFICINNTNSNAIAGAPCSAALANFTYTLTNVTLIRGVENDHPNYLSALENGVDTNNTCEWTFNTNITGSDGSSMPFWIKSGVYKFAVLLKDQGNLSIAPVLSGSVYAAGYGAGKFFYNTVSSANFTDTIVPGDSAGANVLGTFNDGDNQYVMTNAGNNILDINWTATNFTSPEAKKNWTLKADEGTEGDNDFVVDDDPIQGTDSSDSNNLSQVVITNYFDDNSGGGRLVHDTGLELCIADDCDSAQSQATYNESIPLYFHIRPPTGLASGTYSGTLTYTLTACSRSGCIYPTY